MNTQEILKQLTIEEKILLMQAKDMWSLNGVERLGIPSVVLTDGPNGVRMMMPNGQGTEPSTAIPTESILSASWDTELIYQIGKMLAEECHHYGIGILLGPGVNAKRSPLAGRNFEYYSEDPYLSGKLAAAFIDGVQNEGIGTSLKHYVANDQETRRFTMDADVDERTLREICLKPFEIAIKEAKPWTIMAAYPRLRGTYLCENDYVLQNVLRDEYGYTGTVLSDWSATVNKVTSHKNGLDLETGSFARKEEMLAAIENGALPIEIVDKHTARVLELIDNVMKGRKTVDVNWDAHHALARKAAAESAVLLKNEDELLPLSCQSKVAVIGTFAKKPHFKGGGSSGTNPRQLDDAFTYISNYAKTEYSAGYQNEQADAALISEAVCIAKGKDAVIVFLGTTEVTESEGSDRSNMLLPESHVALVHALAKANPNIVVVNSSGAPVEFRQIESEARAILHAGLAGEGGGSAVADLLFGIKNPCGKLTETFPIRLEHTPAYPFFPGYRDQVTYHEELLVGYRYYDTKKIPVQYPFGHGLSYTTFVYSNLRLSKDTLTNGESIIVTLDVTNTGNRLGKEIVQIYVADEDSYLTRPEKELKGFAKVTLSPRETKSVSIELDENAFAYYVPHLNRYAVESGTFRILAAASAEDVRLQAEIRFDSKDEVRMPFTKYNTLGEFYSDDRYAEATREVYKMLGIDEHDAGFPILSGITLKDIPSFLAFTQTPSEIGKKMQEMILPGCTDEDC